MGEPDSANFVADSLPLTGGALMLTDRSGQEHDASGSSAAAAATSFPAGGGDYLGDGDDDDEEEDDDYEQADNERLQEEADEEADDEYEDIDDRHMDIDDNGNEMVEEDEGQRDASSNFDAAADRSAYQPGNSSQTDKREASASAARQLETESVLKEVFNASNVAAAARLPRGSPGAASAAAVGAGAGGAACAPAVAAENSYGRGAAAHEEFEDEVLEDSDSDGEGEKKQKEKKKEEEDEDDEEEEGAGAAAGAEATAEPGEQASIRGGQLAGADAAAAVAGSPRARPASGLVPPSPGPPQSLASSKKGPSAAAAAASGPAKVSAAHFYTDGATGKQVVFSRGEDEEILGVGTSGAVTDWGERARQLVAEGKLGGDKNGRNIERRFADLKRILGI